MTDQPKYAISAGGKSITCFTCGFESHNQNDVKNRYCARCHVFHGDATFGQKLDALDEMRDADKVEKLRRLREEIDKGIRSLEAGEGMPLEFESFLRVNKKPG